MSTFRLKPWQLTVTINSQHIHIIIFHCKVLNSVGRVNPIQVQANSKGHRKNVFIKSYSFEKQNGFVNDTLFASDFTAIEEYVSSALKFILQWMGAIQEVEHRRALVSRTSLD